jgi:predicted  nucleic acid-binding Zn-ribbon protein
LQAITVRYDSLDDDVANRLKKGLSDLENTLKDRKSVAEAEWLLGFEKKNQQAIDAANGKLKEIEEKRQSILSEINDMRDRLNSIDANEAAIDLVKSEFRLAVIEYHSASKHIHMLTKALKPIARSSGIPWPIDDKFVEELKEAGNSRILDALLK